MSELANKLKGLIKTTPGILLVRLADLADCDVDAVHVELADDIRRGEILSEKTDGPNGHKTQAFRLNPTFLGWGEPPQAAPFTRSLQAINFDTTAPSPAQPTESKVQKAIAYLEKCNSASSAELHAVMGLDKKHSPLQYLSHPIKTGRILREGDAYRLGNDDGVKRIRRARIAPMKPAAIPTVATSATLPSSAEVIGPTDATEDAIAASMQVGDLHIVAWERSGRMVLTVHGSTLQLDSAHVRALAAFVGLMGANHG